MAAARHLRQGGREGGGRRRNRNRPLRQRSIPNVTQSIRDMITQRVESMTGLRVSEVNIIVKDAFFPQQ